MHGGIAAVVNEVLSTKIRCPSVLKRWSSGAMCVATLVKRIMGGKKRILRERGRLLRDAKGTPSLTIVLLCVVMG